MELQVLLVEDDDMKAKVLTLLIERAAPGARVARAVTLAAAFGAGIHPDVVVTDWNFPTRPHDRPRPNGDLVVAHARGRGLPVAVVSGDPRPARFEGTWFGPMEWEGVAAFVAEALDAVAGRRAS